MYGTLSKGREGGGSVSILFSQQKLRVKPTDLPNPFQAEKMLTMQISFTAASNPSFPMKK
jgi:hypothetical protein